MMITHHFENEMTNHQIITIPFCSIYAHMLQRVLMK